MIGAAIGRVLVTGCAGFIGMHTATRLLDAGVSVLGVDNFDPYYDVSLKRARVARLDGRPGFRFERADLADTAATEACFAITRSPTSFILPHSPECGIRSSIRTHTSGTIWSRSGM